MLGVYNWWHGVPKFKAATKKIDDPIRFGVLGAAAINYAGLFDPIESHPGATINGVAARSLTKAQAQIAKYKLTSAKAYRSYDELLSDPKIDAVYIPLPNGLHFEWAVKSMQAGKHVLIEKPIASNAEQARRIQETSKATGKVALEAFHWRFHPAAHKVKDLVTSGNYGNVQRVSAEFYIPAPFIPKDDIRFQYDLAGGACMDLTYVFSGTTYMACGKMKESSFNVTQAKARRAPQDNDVDEAMEATFEVHQPGRFVPTVTCEVKADLALPKLFGLIPKIWASMPTLLIELEGAQIAFPAFVGPFISHTITITEKDSDGALTKNKHMEQCYVGGPQWGDRVGARFWTTYRYQLEAFVNMIKAKESGEEYRGPDVSLDDSIKLIELIDSVYQKADLPKRGL